MHNLCFLQPVFHSTKSTSALRVFSHRAQKNDENVWTLVYKSVCFGKCSLVQVMFHLLHVPHFKAFIRSQLSCFFRDTRFYNAAQSPCDKLISSYVWFFRRPERKLLPPTIEFRHSFFSVTPLFVILLWSEVSRHLLFQFFGFSRKRSYGLTIHRIPKFWVSH